MSEVYANILETLTSGLYNDVKYAVREYLQNSYDAIKQANKEKIPVPSDGFYVDVALTKNNKIITITDNGIGMDPGLLREYTSIGGGTKNSPELAGHKGIGKLSGLRFFEEFKVRTKVFGAEKATELYWKCGDMMRVLMTEKEKMKKISYKDFISQFFTIEEVDEEDKNRHYTQIQLLNVSEEFKDQVGEERIGQFIKQNCPVPFLSDSFRFSDKISEYLGQDLFFIDSYINGKVIYQFYNDSYKLVDPQLMEIKYDNIVRAKVWFSWIKDTAEIIEDEKIRGLKFRCKGLCVGDNNLFANNCMPPGRDQFANWFTGEIVVLDDDIRPSAARDKFYEGAGIRKFYNELRNKVGKELSFIASMRSEINSAINDFNDIKIMQREGKTVPAVKLKRIEERSKELKRYKEKDKYGFGFEIITNLDQLLKGEEAREVKDANKAETELKDIQEKGQTAIIEKMLTLKEEQLNSYSKNVKAKKQSQIDKLKKMVVDQPKISEKEVEDSLTSQIVEIIIKFCESKNVSFKKAEITKFVTDELRRRKNC